MEPITIERDECQNLESALRKEWLLANGLGGYSSSTVVLANTRRYHGLLVAATKPPLGRIVFLSALEESIEVDEEKFYLSNHLYPETIFPKGYQYLVRFSLDPFPVLVYDVEGVELMKSIFMVHGENTVVVTYRLLRADSPVKLEVRPLVAFRDFHALTMENPVMDNTLKTAKGQLVIHPYKELPPLYFYHNAAITDKSGYWYKNFEYPRELERGFDYHEDLFSPFSLIYSFVTNDEAWCCATLSEKRGVEPDKLREKETARYAKLQGRFPLREQAWGYLWQNSDHFLVERKGGEKSIIAGYPWFEDWGRDTMISLRGLTLTTGRYETAKDILISYSQFVSQGMIPNRFVEVDEEPEYNTVDASLWYVQAVYDYLEYTDDWERIERALYPVLKKIIKFYQKGTRYGIHADSDSLITAGEPGVSLTWMDARVGEVCVTQRKGKAVEINALWYNALRIVAGLANKLHDEVFQNECNALAKKVRRSFDEVFWFEEGGYLYDVVDGDFKDPSLRPNQIFAISLPFAVLDERKWKSVLKRIEEEVLTPYGLRTLSPKDPKYIGRYQGDAVRRDGAYHQGTVWPWLLGPYISATLKAEGRTREVKARLATLLESLLQFVEGQGMGTVPEVFDGDAPQEAGGCISQAWSVAELLRCYEMLRAEDVQAEKAPDFILR